MSTTAAGSGLLWQVGAAAQPFQPLGVVVLGAAALALLVTPVPWQAAVASGLLGWVAWQSLPPAWAPVGVASVGAALCYAGVLLRGRLQAGLALHHAGWVLALLALAGLSRLDHPAMVRVFRADLAPLTEARLRAAAITAIYAASAWRPLMFQESWAMLACVVGVAAGVALRIRSYVYLGTGFLVTTVAANLVHYGVRDHRLGAAFLSALGLLVVGFMVLLSAQRKEVLRRYRRMRALIEEWQA